jgi:epsilon-lactone hydrolase
MQTAGDDPIRCDALDIARAVLATGAGSVDHRVFDSLWHVFHLQVSILPEAREAVADLGAKLRSHLQTSSDIRISNVKVA